MKKLVIISLLLCFTILSCIKSKEVLIRNYNLSSHLSEISGLVRIDNRYFAHNDGGDEANLYEIDIKTGEILRTILLIGAQNIDWEDIARDSQFIYVGDIGGNNSAREDLTVYKVDINRLLNYDEVNPEIIVIKKSSTRNIDFEAMFIKDSMLYLLSKDLISLNCEVYTIDLSEGSLHSLQDPIESKKFSVAITGADYSEKLNRLILIGYNNPTGDSSIDRNVEQIKNFKVQIIEIDNIDIELFSPRQKTQTNNIINALEVLQAESISFSEKSNKYFIASEQSLKTPKFPARIYSYFK